MSDKKEKPTSEEYRKEADEHLNAVKDVWKVFGKTGIFVLAAVIAMIVFGVAWFVNNSRVQMESTSVSSAGSDFELAVLGTEGKWDSKLASDVQTGGEETIDGKLFRATGNGNSSIRWAISSSSNINNDTEEGIRPGAKGELTFYILPKRTGNLSVSLKLALTGLEEKVEGSKTSTAAVSEVIQDLLEGHILLFAGCEGNSSYSTYSGWISEDAEPWIMTLNQDGGNASLRFETDGKLTWECYVESGKAYPVTIYWIWPEVLGEFIFKDGVNIGQRPVLFPDDKEDVSEKNPSALPSSLFKKMCEIEADAVSNRYFRLPSGDTDFSKICSEEILQNMRKGDFNISAYRNLCAYYNSADQYLGETVDYMNLTLDAQ